MEARVHLIAVDIWAHYRKFLKPDGFKAQIVAIDRPACAAYKKALDRVIARSLQKTEHLEPEEAQAQATAMSACIFSPDQHDKKKHPELHKLQLSDAEIKKIKTEFVEKSDPPVFLIVCNKLLTGFDAPVEHAMYLDNPLTDHNLLQAIARTNRRYGKSKEHGIVIDYMDRPRLSIRDT